MKLSNIEKALEIIYSDLIAFEPVAEEYSLLVHPKYRLSTKNLLRYLILRKYDLRSIHDTLSEFGISSLRSSEAYVFKNVLNALKLTKMLNGEQNVELAEIEGIGYKKSIKLLQKHAGALFNSKHDHHFTDIMVTMPSEAAINIKLIKKLIKGGMAIARINLSHDDMDTWKKMIRNIKAAAKDQNKKVKIYMDLAGPKIRTGKIALKMNNGEIQDYIPIYSGDHLILRKGMQNAQAPVYDENNELVTPAILGVTIDQIIEDLKKNDLIYFDDGLFKAKVIKKETDQIELVIDKAYKRKLKSCKGINLPNTRLNLPALTTSDLNMLPFVLKHADIVGYSFLRSPDDVKILYREIYNLESAHDKDMGVVFKIENKEAFENLPLILMEAMKKSKIGIMIARGDLAVEIGYERISEVQNQILWFCEAAHIPVIWATQVFENLAKKGIATRAEVSDAAWSARAECVMLNKGPYIVEAVVTLKDILKRMQPHANKKKDLMRALHVATKNLEKINKNPLKQIQELVEV